MKSVLRPALLISLFGAAMVGVLVLTMATLNRPVAGSTTKYRADFTEISGLREGDDVRILGVAVGKVEKIELSQAANHTSSLARVTFTVLDDYTLTTASDVAVRYQNLAGNRYLAVDNDATDAGDPGQPVVLAANATIGLEHTIPSFDITTIFNGLKPVLSTMNTDQINHFAESALAVVQGDGSGLDGLLDSVDTLIGLANDRQTVLTTLVTNLGELSAQVDGKSAQLTDTITLLNDLMGALLGLNDKLETMQDKSAAVATNLNALLASVGFTPVENPDLEAITGNLLPFGKTAVDVLKLAPGLFQLLLHSIPATNVGAVATCSVGVATLPQELGILLGGQPITVCKGA